MSSSANHFVGLSGFGEELRGWGSTVCECFCPLAPAVRMPQNLNSYPQRKRTSQHWTSSAFKYVPDAKPDRTFNESDNTTDRVGVDGLLPELDEYTVQAGLNMVESDAGEGAVERRVTVLTVGPDRAADAVKKALQMGAHRGGPCPRRGDPRVRRGRHLADPGRGREEDRGPGPDPDRHGVHGWRDGRGSGHARRAPGPTAGEAGLRADRRGRHRDHSSRRRRGLRSIGRPDCGCR